MGMATLRKQSVEGYKQTRMNFRQVLSAHCYCDTMETLAKCIINLLFHLDIAIQLINWCNSVSIATEMII